MFVCINPYSCPYKNCKRLHNQKRKFFKTLEICKNYQYCSDYDNCKKFHPYRCYFLNYQSDCIKELLPKDIIENILLYLDFKDIDKLYSTSKQFDYLFDRIKNPFKIQHLMHIKNYRKKINILKYEYTGHRLKLYTDDEKIFVFRNLYNYYETFLWDQYSLIPQQIDNNTIFLGYKNLKIYNPQKNEIVDAMDNEGVWYQAKIIDKTDRYYIVHFLSWSEKYDIKIMKNSYCIAKLHTYTPNWKSNIKLNDLIDIKIQNLWYVGNICDISLDYIWVKVKNKKKNSFQIIKKQLNEETIAEHKTHTELYISDPRSIYRIRYFTTNILHQKLEKGSVPLYLKKIQDKYWDLVKNI